MPEEHASTLKEAVKCLNECSHAEREQQREGPDVISCFIAAGDQLETTDTAQIQAPITNQRSNQQREMAPNSDRLVQLEPSKSNCDQYRTMKPVSPPLIRPQDKPPVVMPNPASEHKKVPVFGKSSGSYEFEFDPEMFREPADPEKASHSRNNPSCVLNNDVCQLRRELRRAHKQIKMQEQLWNVSCVLLRATLNVLCNVGCKQRTCLTAL